jgi:hypothetical protein
MEDTTINQSDDDELLEGETGGSFTDLDKVYPNAEVRVEKAQYSTIHLKRLVEERKELIIDPDFQRANVWTKNQGSELVESILMGIPIPTMYFFEMRNGKKQVVDGRQRITAILDFLNDKLILKDLKILHQYNGFRFSQLDSKMQGIFEDYQLSFYIIQPPTPERVKYDIFDRVNRGGTKLNSQEMRNALYRGRSTKLLLDLSLSDEFLTATDHSIESKRKKDQYVILRAIAFYLYNEKSEEISSLNGEPIEYKSDIDDFLAKTMVFLNEKAEDQMIEECKAMFTKSMDNCFHIMGADSFRFYSEGARRRPINMPLFEVMVYIFSYDCVNNNPTLTKSEVNHFKEKCDHQQMFSGNVDSSLNLSERFSIARELIKKIENDTENNYTQL